MKIKGIIICLLMISGSMWVCAQTDNKDHKEKNQPDVKCPPPMPLPGILPLNFPDLTKEQHEKLKAVDIKYLEVVNPLKSQINAKQAELVMLLTANSFENKEADKVAEELGKLRTAILKEDIKRDQNMREILTAEQKIIFDAQPKPFLKP